MGRIRSNKINRVNLTKASGKLFVTEPEYGDREVFIRIEDFLKSPEVLDILENNVGHVTKITAGTGLNGGTITSQGTISLKNTTVTPGTYTTADITIDAQGRITAAANGSAAASAGTNSEFQFTDNAGGFFAGAIQQSAGHVVPTTTGVTNLGSATNYFSQLYAGTNWFYNGTTLVIKNNTPSDVMALSNSALSLYGGRNLAFTNTASDITWTSNGTISCAAADLLKLENSGAYLTFGQIGDGYGIGINRAANRSASLALAAQNPTTLSYQGFSLPSMTFANQSAVSSPLNGLQVHIEDGTDSIPYYNHSVDGWVPVGRYANKGGIIDGGVAATGNRHLVSSNADGEINYAPFRWAETGATPYMYGVAKNTNVTTSANLGSSSTNVRWLNLYFRGYLDHRYGKMRWTTGTHAGAKFEQGTLRVGFTATTSQGGIIVRNDGVDTYDLDVSAMLELRSTSRGFLPPKMTTVQMNAISSPATGLMIYDTTTNQWMGYNGTSWVIIG